MTNASYPLLTSPLKLGQVTLRNRMVFTGHNSKLQEADGTVGDRYIAYQVARTRGGAGLQLLCAASIDEMSFSSTDQLRLSDDSAIPGLRRMADAVAAEGGIVFAQLLHPGRDIYEAADGTRPRSVAPSPVRHERFFSVPRELSVAQIKGIVQSYARAAERAVKAGMRGVEIVANQGNLPAQFLTASLNRRTDEYGGTSEKRARFLIEISEAIRNAIGPDVPLGMRISVSDMDGVGLEDQDTVAFCQAIDRLRLLDYFHVVLGSTATRAASSHIVSPMYRAAGYVTPYARKIKDVVSVPVIATGRYNTPQAAEAAIASGAADAIGMTRAMISDPQMSRKVIEGRTEDIRACIGCVQACIGHFQKGAPVSCIQHPETGRETTLGNWSATERPRHILVAGGGPAGMKAAAVAAARGHRVTLCEAGPQLGGQANLAARLPGRAEFGGIVTNLEHEMRLAQVEIRLRTPVTRELVEALAPDAVVIATGGQAAMPEVDLDGVQLVSAEDVVAGRVKVGGKVLVADTTADWVGPGVARHLAQNGHQVTLSVTGICPAETLPPYVRDEAIAALHGAGVAIQTYARLFGAAAGTVFLQQTFSGQAIELEGIDTVVAAFGTAAHRKLEAELQGMAVETHVIGDCWAPRTAEEAVLEGLQVAVAL